MSIYKTLKLLIILNIVLALFSNIRAVEAKKLPIIIINSTNKIQIDHNFNIEILIDANGKSINAISGTIEFSKNIIVKNINFNNSIINMWVNIPRVELLNNKRIIKFSGIIPGGFSGIIKANDSNSKPGKLFDIDFYADIVENISIHSSNVNVYLNDGYGSKLNIQDFTKNIEIIKRDKKLIDFNKQNINTAGTKENNIDLSPPIINSVSIIDSGDGNDILTLNVFDNESGIRDVRVRFFSFFKWHKWNSFENSIITPKFSIIAQIFVENNDKLSIIKNVYFYDKIVLFIISSLILLILILILVYIKTKRKTKI